MVGVAGLARPTAGVARDDAVADRRLDVVVERAAGHHVLERAGRQQRTQVPPGGDDVDLRQLAAGHVGVRAEVRALLGVARLARPAAGVAADDAVRRRRLDHGEEGRVRRHVREGISARRGGRGDRPAEAEDDDLDHLRARRVVIGPEGAVGVAADDAVAGQIQHGLVEVVRGVHIGEAERAGRGRGAGLPGVGGASACRCRARRGGQRRVDPGARVERCRRPRRRRRARPRCRARRWSGAPDRCSRPRPRRCRPSARLPCPRAGPPDSCRPPRRRTARGPRRRSGRLSSRRWSGWARRSRWCRPVERERFGVPVSAVAPTPRAAGPAAVAASGG